MSRYGDGAIDQRGENSFRLRWRVDGKRYSKTVAGSITDAKRELRKLLRSADTGTHVAPAKLTISDYVTTWLDNSRDLSPKTLERYRELSAKQIIPHLGTIALQALRPAQIEAWHSTLIRAGGANGVPLSPRTVGHAHRLLHVVLDHAMRLEVIGRNVASIVSPPKVDRVEIEILTAEQINAVLARLADHSLLPIVAMALGTGMRRGELCGLAWGTVDLDKATVRVERSMEQTRAGLRFKPPKTNSGRRTISLAQGTVAMLREHRARQMELRLKLGAGKLGDDDLVFAKADGSPYKPDDLSRDWGMVGRRWGLPRVPFHALRHTHASALIAAGLDVVSVSKRLGHATPTITLSVYSHLFDRADTRAAAAIDTILGKGST
jgi:integrase